MRGFDGQAAPRGMPQPRVAPEIEQGEAMEPAGADSIEDREIAVPENGGTRGGDRSLPAPARPARGKHRAART